MMQNLWIKNIHDPYICNLKLMTYPIDILMPYINSLQNNRDDFKTSQAWQKFLSQAWQKFF